MTTRLRRNLLEGREAYTADGEKLGRIDEIYYDAASDTPEWVAVKGGFLGLKRRLVPLDGAAVHGDHLDLAFSKKQLADAPDFDEGTMRSDHDESRLFGHYGVEYPGRSFGHGAVTDDGSPAGETNSLVRHEEELKVGTRTVDAGSVRLRRWVETRPVSEDVTLERETARIEHEPINQVVSDADFGDAEVRVDLHAEEAVVSKETIARERVRIDKDVIRETEQVSDVVREEQIDIDRDDS